MTANWRIPKEKIQEQIEKIIIPFPHLNDQKFIISIREKLNSLSETLMDFKSLFSINPNQGKEFYDQLIQMLEVIGKLTLPEKVRQIIREGETKNAEFKQTLSLDVKKQTKEKHLELSALKTVAGFLNASGGNLIIGVDDDRNIIGLNKEINKLHKNLDKFLLHWKNLIKNSIGEEFYPYIDYKIININDKNLLFVECRGSKDPCYLYKKDFYVRTNPATDKLEGPQLVKYIKNHFKS
jgi:uncharacterized protein YaaQ